MIKEWNGDKVRNKHRRMVKAGIDHASLSVLTHIKVDYQRPITGKGFTDRTGALRKSGNHLTIMGPRYIRGFVHFGFGMDYALHVENVAGGKYAFMGPGFRDMRPKLHNLFMAGARATL